ncbi:COX15/CtaA family protein [Phycisphaeraceae bacterium D3-23]
MPAPTLDNTACEDVRDAPAYRPWLHRFSFVALAATFALVAIGGHVTSTESGMAVPDGWYTFGWWSLFAPPSEWWHNFGTFWEHSHRLQGNVVGMLSIAMAIWLYVAYTDWDQLEDPHGKRGKLSKLFRSVVLVHGKRPWLRWAGVLMLLWVCAQGALGAFRVDEVSITLAFFHGISGQMILCFWVLIAAALSRPWVERVLAIKQKTPTVSPSWLRFFALALLVALLVQLTLGAAVRHYKADKAIPDFPLHFGQVLPPSNQEAYDEAYLAYHAEQAGLTLEQARAGGWSNRSPRNGDIVIPAWKAHLQFAHRVWGYSLFVSGVTLIVLTMRSALDKRLLMTPAMTLLSLFVLQVSLGAITVMTQTDIFAATMHQATGALLLATATWLSIRVHLAGYPPATTPAFSAAPSDKTHTPDTTPSTLLPRTTA